MKCLVGFLVVLNMTLSAHAQFIKGFIPKQSRDTVLHDDNVVEVRTRHDLVIVPAMINKKWRVNLALDPYCKSVILFGNRFKRLLKVQGGKRKKHDEELMEMLSTSNTVAVGPVVATDIPIIVIPNQDAVNFFTGVHGVINPDFLNGYDVTIDRKKLLMTIKHPASAAVTKHAVRNRN